MDKKETLEFLRSKNIWLEVTEHKAVYNMAELADVEIPYPEADAKNLFVRDDKKRNYYLLVIRGAKKADLQEFRRQHGTRALSFASPDDRMSIMGLAPGSVTPLGILNDEERRVKVFLDADLAGENGIIGVHPNDNTATVWMRTADLIKIIKEHGNEIETVGSCKQIQDQES